MDIYTIRKVITGIVLCALILSLAGCADIGIDQDTVEADKFCTEFQRYYNDPEYAFYIALTDYFDQALEDYRGSNYGVDNIKSAVSFHTGYYTYVAYDADTGKAHLVEIPLSAELVDWWNNYGGDVLDNLDGFRRPMANIQFNGTSFELVHANIPANATEEEMNQIPDDEKREVNKDIVCEYLMREYGIPKDKVNEIFIHDVLEVRSPTCVIGVYYLWISTTDAAGNITVTKLTPSHEQYFFADAEEVYYLATGTEDPTTVWPHFGAYPYGWSWWNEADAAG